MLVGLYSMLGSTRWRIVFKYICILYVCIPKKFEDTKAVIRSRKLKKYRQYNDQKKKDKQRSTKHYAEN